MKVVLRNIAEFVVAAAVIAFIYMIGFSHGRRSKEAEVERPLACTPMKEMGHKVMYCERK